MTRGNSNKERWKTRLPNQVSAKKYNNQFFTPNFVQKFKESHIFAKENTGCVHFYLHENESRKTKQKRKERQFHSTVGPFNTASRVASGLHVSKI